MSNVSFRKCPPPSVRPFAPCSPSVRPSLNTGTWHPLADLLTSRGYLSSTFALDGKLYTAGGCGKSFGDPVDAFEVYEPAADKWRALAPLRAPRSNLSLVLAL